MLSIEACCFIEHFFGKNASTYVYMGTAVHVDVSLYGLIPPCTITCGSRGIWGFPLENQNLLNSHSKISENMLSPTGNTIFLWTLPPPKKKNPCMYHAVVKIRLVPYPVKKITLYTLCQGKSHAMVLGWLHEVLHFQEFGTWHHSPHYSVLRRCL